MLVHALQTYFRIIPVVDYRLWFSLLCIVHSELKFPRDRYACGGGNISDSEQCKLAWSVGGNTDGINNND
jgi:hypothetical protein